MPILRLWLKIRPRGISWALEAGAWYGIRVGSTSKTLLCLLRRLRKLLILLGYSNEVQNFLYLSQSFASSNITEGMYTRLV